MYLLLKIPATKRHNCALSGWPRMPHLPITHSCRSSRRMWYKSMSFSFCLHEWGRGIWIYPFLIEDRILSLSSPTFFWTFIKYWLHLKLRLSNVETSHLFAWLGGACYWLAFDCVKDAVGELIDISLAEIIWGEIVAYSHGWQMCKRMISQEPVYGRLWLLE